MERQDFLTDVTAAHLNMQVTKQKQFQSFTASYDKRIRSLSGYPSGWMEINKFFGLL